MEKTIVITGASDGIGASAAQTLKEAGNQVVVVGRDKSKTAMFANKINSPFEVVDFCSLEEVRGLANSLITNYEKIDILANNAGAMFGKSARTIDGFERTFQVNHLAPFLLTHLLHEKLLSSNATIINTSSMTAKMWGQLKISDLNNEVNYEEKLAYGNSKLCNILFTKELHRRFNGFGINAVSFHPGVVATNFASDPESSFHGVYHSTGEPKLKMITPAQGADQLIWLSTEMAGKDWISGEYYDLREIGQTHEQAGDLDLAEILWNESVKLLNI